MVVTFIYLFCGCCDDEVLCTQAGETLNKVESITKSYGMGKTRLHVLSGVNLTVKKGQYMAVVGASGSGKSTLLHILGALDRPDSGAVFYRKQNLADLRWGKLNHFRNKEVGFVFQFYHLMPEFTALENVLLPKMIGRKINKEAKDSLKKVIVSNKAEL